MRELIEELKNNKGSTTLKFREKLSRIAFTETAYYDSVISNYFNKISNTTFPDKRTFHANLIETPDMVKIHTKKVQYIPKILT